MTYKTKNILFISYDGMTDPLGQSQVIPYMSGLSKLGYGIHILSCEKENQYQKKKTEIEELLSNFGIKWYPVMYHKQPPVLSTVYDINILKRKAHEICESENIQIVHCRSYISAFVGLWLKKKKSMPYVFDMRGFYPDERVDGKLWNLKNPLFYCIYKYFKKKEKQFLLEADAIVTLTYAAKKVIEDWRIFNTASKIIKVIPCSADFNLFKITPPEIKKSNREKLGISQESLIITYLGSLGTWYMLNEMLDFFKALLKKHPSAKFIFLTPDHENVVYSLSDLKGIPRETLVVQFVERKFLVDYLSISDWSVFFIKPAFSKLASSPTKLGELFAMGIPVICNKGVGDVDQIISETEGGYSIKKFCEQEYENAVSQMELMNNLDPQKLRMKALEYFDLAKAVNSYAEIYASFN